MVDDAADRERRESAAAERPEFSGRDHPAAVSSMRRPTPRTTTARWARSSATKSATASTTRAASSTPRAGWRTGGRRTISSTSRPPAAALAAQFDAYRPFPDLAVNGHQTLSENIADLAGLLAAYDAYRLSLGGKPDAVKDGLTGDQRFFISFAQSWRAKMRDARVAPRDRHGRPRARPIPRRAQCATWTLVRRVLCRSPAEALPGAAAARTRLVGQEPRPMKSALSKAGPILKVLFGVGIVAWMVSSGKLNLAQVGRSLAQ